MTRSYGREVGTADIFVVIVGGRYGSPASDHKDIEEYDSITRRELQTAIARQILTYVLSRSVLSKENHRTYPRNKETETIRYVHVDNVQIYRTIEWIESLKKNNPTHAFEHANDITQWLRDQWAGLYRELLSRESTDEKASGSS